MAVLLAVTVPCAITACTTVTYTERVFVSSASLLTLVQSRALRAGVGCQEAAELDMQVQMLVCKHAAGLGCASGTGCSTCECRHRCA